MSFKSAIVRGYVGLFRRTLSVLSRENRQMALFDLFRDADGYTSTVETAHGAIRFNCPTPLALWRLKTFFTKEPETLEWIDSMDKEDVLLDIGANVGMYTIYAAKKGHTVLAVEPFSRNYALLNTNIFLNRMDSRVSAYCMAFSREDRLGHLNVTTMETGGACSLFGDKVDGLHVSEVSQDVTFHQGVLGMSVDSFLSRFDVPFPTHIKIDVDGIEPEILEGAPATLADPRLKSVLLEIDENDTPCLERITGLFAAHGLTLKHKAQSELVASGPYASVFNHIFGR